MADFVLPHPIYGTITNHGNGINIIIKNKRTGDTITTTTNRSSKYVVDAANFTNSYENTDEIELIFDDLPQHTDNIKTDNGDIRIE